MKWGSQSKDYPDGVKNDLPIMPEISPEKQYRKPRIFRRAGRALPHRAKLSLMRILLTGATGFFGGLLLQELLAGRHEVTALTRGGNRLPAAPGLTELDRDFSALIGGDPLWTGHDAVIHAAAVVKMWARDPREFERINVAGAQRFLRAASDAKITRIIHLSSFIALGPSTGGRPREAHDLNPGPFRNEYERSKTLGCVAARNLQGEGRPIFIVYPGVLYGPGALTDGNLVVKIILALAARRLPGYIGKGAVSWSYTWAPAAAAALVRLATGTMTGDFVLGGDNRTTREFYDLLPLALGHPIPDRAIPYWLGKTIGAAQVAIARLTGKPPQLTPAVVEIYKQSWALNSAPAVRDLSYEIMPLGEGLQRTVGWLRAEGKLPAQDGG